MRFAVVACEEFPELDEDWPRLRSALGTLGVEASAHVWTDPEVDWRSFALVVVRGPWDYTGRRDEFTAWSRRVESQTQLVNPAPVLEWNTDKAYLADLASAGVPTVPTEWVRPGQSWRPPDGEFVIKPAVSAGGFETARYHADEVATAEHHVVRLHRAGLTVMVQPYQQTVDHAGETALIYFGGRLSHAIRKGPLLERGAGVRDRLWEEQVISPADSTDAEVAVGQAALSAAHRLAGPTAYGRVDLVPRADGTPAVLELELVEPALFLSYSAGAAERFAAVLRSQAGDG